MTGSALLLVLGAAVLHAGWNMAAKTKVGDSYVFVWWYTTLSAVLLAPVAVLQLLREPGTDWATLLLGAAGSGLLHVGYSLCLQVGYDRAPLGIVYPAARGTGPTLTLAVALLFLGERLSPAALCGAALVILGIVVTALPGRSGSVLPGQEAGRSPLLAGVLWGTATGAFISGYTLWDDHSVHLWHAPPLPYFALVCAVEAVLLSLRMTPARRTLVRETGHRNRGTILLVALASPVAYILVLVALQTQPVSLVAPLRESSIVIGSLAAWLLFKERHPARRLLGAALVLGGIVLVAG